MSLSRERETGSESAEQQLRYRPDFITALTDSLGEGVYALDREGRVTFMNPAAERKLGWKFAELRGQHVHEAIHFQRADGTRAPAAECPLLGVMESKTTLSGDDVFTRKDGSLLHISYTSSPIITDGEVTGAVLAFRDITERKRAEQALLESEERYRTVAETASDAIITVDAESNILFINHAAERIFGHTVGEMVGQSLTMLMPDYMRRLHREGLARYVETGRKHISWNGVELPGLHKKGHEIPLEVSFSETVRNGNHYFTGIARDITERKRAEEAQAERTRMAALGADIGVALTQGDSLRDMLRRCTETLVRHLDAAFARVWTLNEADDVLELQASSGIYTHLDGPHSRVPVGKFKIGLIAGERRPHLTNSVIGDPRVGDQEWAQSEGMVAFAGYPLIVEDRLLGVVAMFARHALTEAALDALASIANGLALGIDRARVEAELSAQKEESARLNEDQFRTLADSIPQLAWMADADGFIFWYNQRWYDYTGTTLEEMQGWNWQSVHDPEVLPRVMEEWQASISTGNLFEMKFPLRSREGGFRWFLTRVWPMRDAGGRVARWFGTNTDIEEQRRAEEALVRANAEMEARVAERTAELSRANAVLEEQIAERRRAEDELQKQREFLSALLDNLAEGIVACNAEGVLTLFNRATREFHGLPEEQLPAAEWAEHYDLYQADGQTRMETADIPLFLALAGQHVRDVEMVIAPKGRAARTLLANGQPIIDSEGRKLGAVVAMHDITERKHAEEERARLVLDRAMREQMLEELSTPLVPVWRDVLVLPIIGSLDTERMERATGAALREVTRTRARACIIDITGARIIDSHAVARLSNLVSALKLIGAEALVTGVGAHAAHSLVTLGLDLQGMRTHRTHAEALASIIKTTSNNL
jgi:PAS domain S-box-containing protein